jgi:hypothetical protein
MQAGEIDGRWAFIFFADGFGHVTLRAQHETLQGIAGLALQILGRVHVFRSAEADQASRVSVVAREGSVGIFSWVFSLSISINPIKELTLSRW